MTFRQLYIRLIFQCKVEKNIEFGAKTSLLSIDVFLNGLEWGAFYEMEKLILHAEKFKALFRYWSKFFHIDKIKNSVKNKEVIKL